MIELKYCSKCDQHKPLDEFYDRKWRGEVSGKDTYCKACVLEKGREYAKASNAGWTREINVEPGAIAVINELAKLGIYAINGKASEFRHVDVVAWGCVRIEVKTALVCDPVVGWRFKFGGKMKADIAILIPDFNGKRSYHIFDAKHPVFYQKSGAVKSSLAWNPNIKRHRSWGDSTYQSLTNALTEEHLNNWSVVEKTRLAFGQNLRSNAA